MSLDQTAPPSLADHLRAPLRVGEPDVHGPLAVFPVFGADPVLEYVSFAQGRELGAGIKELEQGASVNDLLVLNPTDAPVLLYEGEEVLGAQQNRTFDVSVLVPAHAELRVPVSCVEAGRWEGSRHGESFAPAPQTAYPDLRHMKNRHARISAAAGGPARASQSAVWAEVAEKATRLAAHSRTSAMHDIFESRRTRLDEFTDAVRLRDGQIGALAAIGGEVRVLDHVSRPGVFAALHGPLVQGYALDALECDRDGALPLDEARLFVRRVAAARVTERDGIGLGRDVRFTDRDLGGAGLVAGEELVQLTAFAEDAEGPAPGPSAARGRINRPSRRRSA